MPLEISKWINEELSQILDFPVPEDLTKYILSIENPRDLEEYLKTLLNFQIPSHRQFLSELLKKCNDARQNFPSKGSKTSEVEEKYNINKQYDKKANKVLTLELASKRSEQVPTGKKKSKYVGLYTQEGQNKDVILLKGRHKCFCQASKHGLISNCLHCGRIVCEQEGPGPCLFCGKLVYTPDMDLPGVSEIHQEYFKSTKPDSAEWNKAIEQRDRLLEYDRTSERRTKVIDDENDYFSLNSAWLSKEEREQLQRREMELKAKRDESRLNKKITFDFSGRKVIEVDVFNNIYDPDDPVLKAISESVNTNGKAIPNDNIPNMMFPQPVFQEANYMKISKVNADSAVFGMQRVQDQGLMEMSDQGLCLSLHQPWASLLVYGIMKDEGRTWYTSHRGRLWIAAASKVPTLEDIREIKQIFQKFENNDNINFPSQYPTSCLLGYVDVLDCLSQEDYRLQYPQGRSQSPYVLVCDNPHPLPIYFPIQGRHKIYKLESKIHQAAQKSLQRIAKLQAEKMTKEYI